MNINFTHDLAIIGGGPVGLMLANLLKGCDISTLLIEARAQPHAWSRAIGVTPPSLKLLASLGLGERAHQAGVRIKHAVVTEEGETIGHLVFGDTGGSYPWILSLPQAVTEEMLASNVLGSRNVDVRTGTCLDRFTEDKDSVTINTHDASAAQTFRARYLIGCDGSKSTVRCIAGMDGSVFRYRPVFTMADAHDETELGDAGHLFFGKERPVESFPLPGRKRRWIVRTGWNGTPDVDESFSALIQRLAGIHIPESLFDAPSAFEPYRTVAPRYGSGRILLCGDAAHVMSPIGGQGMNTGFGDAAMLSKLLQQIIVDGESPAPLIERYNRIRRRVFHAAATRAALGMRLGVMRGSAGSIFRRILVSKLLGTPASHRYIAKWFTMTNLPEDKRDALKRAAT